MVEVYKEFYKENLDFDPPEGFAEEKEEVQSERKKKKQKTQENSKKKPSTPQKKPKKKEKNIESKYVSILFRIWIMCI
jgi:hypothetical protein